MAEALMGLALNEIDPVDRRRLHQEHLEIDQANGDTEGIAAALWYISLVECQDAEWEQALQALKASQAQFRRVHTPTMLGMVSVWLAICSVHNGDLPRAGQCLDEAMNVYSELGNESGVTTCWWLRCRLKLAEGLLPEVAEALEQVRCINLGDAVPILAARARLAPDFYSDQARAVELRLGGKNSWEVWLNGKLVFGRDEYHTMSEIDPYHMPAQLQPGRNTILVKVCQNEEAEEWTEEWEFQLRITDSLGTPIVSAKTKSPLGR